MEPAKTLGYETAADAETTFLHFAGPDWLEIDADWRKYGDMENSEQILREFFGRFQFESDASETEIKNTCPARSLVTEDGVRVGAGHGDALCFALNRVNPGRFGNRGDGAEP